MIVWAGDAGRGGWESSPSSQGGGDRHWPVGSPGMDLASRSGSFPATLALRTRESLLRVCVRGVLKAHVGASLSSHPLCVSAPPSARGPPHQPSCFLPRPSRPTTQQVERGSLRTLLWPGSPGIRMVYLPGHLRPAGRLPGRAGWGVWLPHPSSWARSASAVLPTPPPAFPLLSLLLHCR